MDQIGLGISISAAVASIDFGRKGFPKDAFHVACSSHRTRLKNILSAIGVDPIEKSLLKQRHSNLATAQNSYAKKQKFALAA